MGMLWLEQDLMMPLGSSTAAGVVLQREEKEGEEGFGREMRALVVAWRRL